MLKLQEAVDNFNNAYPIGSRVLLKKDGVDVPVETRTTSAAFVMCGHSAVIFLDGVSGIYLLSHVFKVLEQPSRESDTA